MPEPEFNPKHIYTLELEFFITKIVPYDNGGVGIPGVIITAKKLPCGNETWVS